MWTRREDIATTNFEGDRDMEKGFAGREIVVGCEVGVRRL